MFVLLSFSSTGGIMSGNTVLNLEAPVFSTVFNLKYELNNL